MCINPLARSNSPRSQVSLRFVLVVPFVLQVILAVGVTNYLSWRSGQRSLNELVAKIQIASSQRLQQSLNEYFGNSRRMVQSTKDAFANGLLSERDLEGIGRYFYSQVRHQNIGYASFGSLSGNYIAAGRMSDGNTKEITRDLIAPALHGNAKNYMTKTNERGDRTDITVIEDYDFQSESWYYRTLQLAPKLKADQGLWQPISTWESPPYPLSISVAQPVYNRDRQLVGVVGIDQRLTQISQFLQSTQPSPKAETFILERDGNLVATSGTQHVDQSPQRLQAQESQNPIVRETSQFLQRKFGNLRQVKQWSTNSFQIQGTRQFLHVMPWKDDWGLDWLVVVVIPESDFTAQIQKNTEKTIQLTALALLVSIALGLYTSRWIIKPILNLKNAAQGLAAGDLSQTVSSSGISELGDLTQAFNYMAAQLQDSFEILEETNNTLEDRIVERTEALAQALANLQQTQAQLIQTEKMSGLGQMVAGVMHEINNPTTFIHGNLTYCRQYLQTLATTFSLYQTEYPEPPPAIAHHLINEDLDFVIQDLPKILTSMEQGTQRIQTIVSSLRSFAHLDESASKAVDLHEGLDSTLELLAHRLHRIKIVKQYGDLAWVHCYPSLLNQVFLNLLSNAIDALEAMPPGDKPQIITLITEQQSDRALIRITDNGPGINPKDQDKIFDPFFTTKPIGKGTGMGLAVAYQIIVQQHQGSLSVANLGGIGAEFTIELPVINT
jgi:signal transduction histidine kinase